MLNRIIINLPGAGSKGKGGASSVSSVPSDSLLVSLLVASLLV